MTHQIREGGPGLELRFLDHRSNEPENRERWRVLISSHASAMRAALRLRTDPLWLEESAHGPILRANGIAGTLLLGTVQIDVVPKHQDDFDDGRWRGALLSMIERAEGRRAAHHLSHRFQMAGATFVDHVAYSYATALAHAFRKGPIRMYEARREQIPVLRGRLLIAEQLRSSLTAPHLLICEVDQLNEDNSINRLLNWAGRQLLLRSSSGLVRRFLSHQLERMSPVPLSNRPPRVRDRTLPRQFSHYEEAVSIANAVVRSVGVSLGGKSSGPAGGFAVGTEKLFELVIQNSLSAASRGQTWTVRAQVSEPFADPISPNPGARYNSKPDNLVLTPTTRLIIDAKYKRFEDADEATASQGSRPTNADLYQMAAAAVAHHTKRALLVYPRMVASDHSADSAIRWWSVDGWTSDLRIGVCTVDLRALGGPQGIASLDRRLAAIVEQATG